MWSKIKAEILGESDSDDEVDDDDDDDSDGDQGVAGGAAAGSHAQMTQQVRRSCYPDTPDFVTFSEEVGTDREFVLSNHVHTCDFPNIFCFPCGTVGSPIYGNSLLSVVVMYCCVPCGVGPLKFAIEADTPVHASFL